MDLEKDGSAIGEIRKLRKKLRQIENLERLDRPLNFEEGQKVARKGSIRSLIQGKLSLIPEEISITPETSSATPEHSEFLADTPTQSPSKQTTSPTKQASAVTDAHRVEEESGFRERMKRSHEQSQNNDEDHALTESTSTEDNKGEIGTKRPREETNASRTGGSGSGDAMSATKQAVTKTQKQEKVTQKGAQRGKSEVERKREEWRKVKFQVQDLEGHNDLVSCVDCKDNIIISGSRDTTVRAWNRSTCDELCSLGGHSGGVTAVCLLSADENRSLAPHYDLEPSACHLALSSSIDCSVRLWDLDSSQELRSIYTFNPVMAMAYLSNEQCVVTGSDGGKVELWDMTTGEIGFSSLTHTDSVSCIKVKGQQVVTSSADGVIKLWEVRERSLCVIFESENIRSQSGVLVQRPIVSLGMGDDVIYYGDDGTNVKILDWRTGVVRKIRNHLGDFGSTDAMYLGDDIYMFSAYDLDNGVGSINFFSTSTNQYIGTACDEETSRIEAICAADRCNSAQCFVTAGRELRLWRSVARNQQSSTDLVTPTFDPTFTLPAEDSDDDSEDDSDTDEGDDVFAAGVGRGSHRRSRRRGSSSSEPQQSSWISWCTLV